MITPDGRLVLPGVTHNLEVRRTGSQLLLRAWSPSVLPGGWAEAVLSDADRHELATYLTDQPASETCISCDEQPAEEHGMCAGCLHDAIRSGWEPA